MRRPLLYALLVLAASARLLLQVAALPPYAGLDEIYHAARLAFVNAESRNPTTAELSLPAYLERSIEQRWDALPAFAIIADRWPDAVRANRNVVVPHPTVDKPYARSNYEAQQPSLYYFLAAPFRGSTDVEELRRWRLLSALLALVVVVATASLAERWFGSTGIVAAVLLVSLPTWLTLVVRAGSDAMACAFVATAVAITAAGPRRPTGVVAEALAWALALAVKLYTWPVAIVLPFFWFRQRPARDRIATTMFCCAVAVVLTLLDVSSRSRNALGVVAFDRPGGAPLTVGLNLRELVTVTIASVAWTGGQHSDALRPAAIVLYLGPVLIALALSVWFDRRMRRTTVSPGVRALPRADAYTGATAAWTQRLAWAALLAFFGAQVFNVVSCVLARRAGNPVPIGGKEGWYWYVLAPLILAAFFAPLLVRLGRGRAALVIWLVGWDILIHECQLFHDFDGSASPLHPTALFRWGPLHLPFTADLHTIGIGPLAANLVALRMTHLAAVGALMFVESLFAREVVR